MVKVKTVEKKIWDIEGFDVCITRPDGTDVKGNFKGMPTYDKDRTAKNEWTVEEWKTKRFKTKYPGFDVVVFDGDGEAVPGNKKLSTVRDSYLDEE